MNPGQSPHYWDYVSHTFTAGAQQSLWRAHSDRVNILLLKDWLGGRQFADILKTDLFDEAMSQGLYPFLRECAHTVHGIDVAAESADRAKKQFPELNQLEQAHSRTWLLFTLPARLRKYTPDVWSKINQDYSRVTRISGTVSGGDIVIMLNSPELMQYAR